MTKRLIGVGVGPGDPELVTVKAVRVLREAVIDPLVPASIRAQEYGRAHLLPPGFDAWFARCVVRDPLARFENAGIAREAFAEMMGRAPAPSSAHRRSAAAAGTALG